MTTATKKPAAKKTAAKKPASKKTAKPSEYKSKVNEAIANIEEMLCTGEFVLRWNAHPMNFVTKRRYSGINLVLLANAAMSDTERKGSRYWLTYKQAEDIGKQVERGQKSTQIIVWVNAKPENEEVERQIKEGSRQPKKFPIGHSIFNAQQLTEYEEEAISVSFSFTEQLERLNSMMEQTGVSFSNSGDSAYYMPAKHHINLPNFADFFGEGDEREMLYLTTLTHELAHSTMKALRPEHFAESIKPIQLDRTSYAKEEVVAELCSAMLCATLGIQKQLMPSHAGYIRGWLTTAKQESPNYFTTACRLASEAHNYLMSFIDESYQPEEAKANDEAVSVQETAPLALAS